LDKQQREHIRDDLKGIIRGECLFDDLTRTLYSTDASIFQIEPAGVVMPRDEEDVKALVLYAAERNIPLIPRGAGTGLAGESLGKGIIVDLSKHFRSILEINADTVRVQPGVICRQLNAQLAKQGRRFAPDPMNRGQCTVGGMLATNASGPLVFRHGYTRDYIAALRAVLNSGENVALGKHSRWPSIESSPGRLEDIVASISTLLDQNVSLIDACRPLTSFNRCGYLLNGVLGQNDVDLAKLVIGSEGTLALITEATLRTIPLPVDGAMVILAFSSLELAVRAAQAASLSLPAACDLMDRRLLALVRTAVPDAAKLIPDMAEAILLIEYESALPQQARQAAFDISKQLHHRERLAFCAHSITEPKNQGEFGYLREAAMRSHHSMRGGLQPQAFIEDVAVPPEKLLTYLHNLQDILQRHETTASFLIHALTGQVQARPFLDMSKSEDVNKLWSIADEVYGIVLDQGGTISSRHGTGLARTPWVARQHGRLLPVLRDVKAIFDPRHLFNPGKIIGPDPEQPAWPLRRQASVDGEGTLRHLVWQSNQMPGEVQHCNGCGLCRTEAANERMCPIFRATHAEAAAPRAKANLLRRLLQNGADTPSFSSKEVREVADLCVNCKMCAHECPAHVNIPKLMLEAKAANASEFGLDRIDWTMSRTESFARLGSNVAAFANTALDSRTIRWLLEKALGISRHRRLPRFAMRNFLRRAVRSGLTRKPKSTHRRVAYFVDIFATYNDPSIAEATVAVLQHNGIAVYVPQGQLGCGMAPLAYGDIECAREVVEHNAHQLADAARDGFTIICSEPTAALMLKQDALDVLDDPDARLVANQTKELTAYLDELNRTGLLRTDLNPLPFSVGHHVPCHLKALGDPIVGPDLLSLIPELSVHKIDVGCSGMAGTYGLQARNRALSLEAGRPMLEQLAHSTVLFGSTECSTCRLQMEDGARKRTLHPVQYLAMSYGYLPELFDRLHEPIRGLVL
jgi:FAD/FMN-containing dehydrogenase/Fe-S oxidoreductase